MKVRHLPSMLLFSILLGIISTAEGLSSVGLSNDKSNVKRTPSMHEAWVTYGDPQANNPEVAIKHRRGNEREQARVVVLDKPFLDDGILPYSILKEAPKHRRLVIVATPGEYEPGSFVIQAGSVALKNIKIEVSELVNKVGIREKISNGAIDIRLVKAWFQSSDTMRINRRNNYKRLVPELLLHDPGLVRVDMKDQTNSVRMSQQFKDSDSLQAFDLPARRNQQVWITLLVPEDATPGEYIGRISIKGMTEGGASFDQQVLLSLSVLPFKLVDNTINMGQFYLARLQDSEKTIFVARGKNRDQMLSELKDMQAHGVNQVTIDHEYLLRAGRSNLKVLARQIDLVKQAGLTERPIIYLDWKVKYHDDKEKYAEKMNRVMKIFQSAGVEGFWVYNRDEKKLRTLRESLHTFRAAKETGQKNVVAVSDPAIAKALRGYLDYALVQHSTSDRLIDQLRETGITPIAYGLPHAGEEKPETTRYTYGFRLALKGFAGTLSYAYQSGECWNDWMKWGVSNYRPNVMAYPTKSKPIPTLQWEAWREGVDDLRYLATYAAVSGKSIEEILNSTPEKVSGVATEFRRFIIERISSIN